MHNAQEDTVAWLVAGDGSEHALAGKQSVGRSAECDLTIDSARVSRQHAVLEVEAGVITVADSGSANGTFVNGAQITAVTVLSHGDQVCFEKHCFRVRLAAGADDATVIASPEADVDATVISEEKATPEEAPAAGVAEASAQDAAPEVRPGAWVEQGTSDQTRLLAPGDAATEEPVETALERALDTPHLLLLAPGVATAKVLELTPTAGEEDEVWEIGRDHGCQVVIDDAAVSEHHAQLVHQDGRWRIVNLVSTNGLFVNGTRRLKSYLADGDRIRLGQSVLAFYSVAGGAGTPHARAAGNGSKKMLWLLAGAAVVALAAVAWWLFGRA
jgi:pSer/pThr/pTyr-binding forkhead associated (FHA) protein